MEHGCGGGLASELIREAPPAADIPPLAPRRSGISPSASHNGRAILGSLASMAS